MTAFLPRARAFFAPFGWRRFALDTIAGVRGLSLGEGMLLGLAEGCVLAAVLLALPA